MSSQPDPLMPLRMLRYVVRILERHRREHGELPLPVVVPVVLHHGEGGWCVARSTEALLDGEFVRAAGLEALIPRMTLLVDDLVSLSDAELAETWIAKGKAEGKAEVLRKLLTLKFGAASLEVHDARIGAGTDADLDRWIERVLGATQADEVFSG